MIKIILSSLLELVLLLSVMSECANVPSTVPSNVPSNNTIPSNDIEAAYGTPEIDGEMDSIWENTNPVIIEYRKSGNSYVGWTKLLWDEQNLYVLSKVYTIDFNDLYMKKQDQDSILFKFDENLEASSETNEDVYDIRVNFNGVVTANNYDGQKVKAKTVRFKNGYFVEMSFPLVTKQLKKGKKIGFAAEISRTDIFSLKGGKYSWPVSEYGTVELKKTVKASEFIEPLYKNPTYDYGSVKYFERPDVIDYVENVSVMFEKQESFHSIIHYNEYPMMEINELAAVIGGTVVNGNTLSKSGINVTYIAGNRIGRDNNGDIMLSCEPVYYDNKLYVPLNSLEITFIYKIEYNRFRKILDIKPRLEPREAEVVFNVRDFGAVGDGVTDDRKAILNAFNAAYGAKRPARLEFEPGKIYRVSETMDSVAFLEIAGMQDFVLDGKGSTLIVEQPLQSFLRLTRCSRVKIINLSFDTNERSLCQGTIKEIDEKNGTLIIEWEDWSPLYAPREWMESTGAEYAEFGMIMHPTENHPIAVGNDHIRFDNMEQIDGRVYKGTVQSGYAWLLSQIKEGYRIVLMVNQKNYDTSKNSKGHVNSNTAFAIDTSEDVWFENLNIYASSGLCIPINYNIGWVTINNVKVIPHEGEIIPCCRDIVHCKNNRGGLVVENCEFAGALDDFINFNGSVAPVNSKTADRTYSIGSSLNCRQGDELVFQNVNTGKVLGIAFIEEIIRSGDGGLSLTVKLDRDIPGIEPKNTITNGRQPTYVYNNITAGSSAVVRNNIFRNGRRHVLLSRGANVLFENNKAENMGGSIVCLAVEIGNFTEGTIPATTTIRNNYAKNCGCSGTTSTCVPLGTNNTVRNNYAELDGVLIENNTFESPSAITVMRIIDVHDLYIKNNVFKVTGGVSDITVPLLIINCEVKELEGNTFESNTQLRGMMGIVHCEYDENWIEKNTVLNDNRTPLLMENKR